MGRGTASIAITLATSLALLRCGTLDGGGSEPGPADSALESFVGDELARDGLTPDETFVQVAAGTYGACALATSGTVYCWGANQLGAVGAPKLGSLLCDINTPCRLPTKVAGLAGKDVVEIAAGAHTSCARTRSGEVWCWGGNDVRQLGTDPPGATPGAFNDTPQLVPSLPIATALRSRNTGSCIVSDDASVLCWGTDDYGDLGRTSLAVTDAGDPGHLPGKVENLGAVDELELGPQNWIACAHTVAGKQIGCWGLNSYGVLGHDPFTDGDETTKANIPFSRKPSYVNDGGAFDALLTVGAGFACSRNGGAVGCWGVANTGQLGVGFLDVANHPSPLLIAKADLVTVRAGYAHACGIDAAGALYCWGVNSRGEQGDDLGEDAGGGYLARTSPHVVAGLPPIAEVAPGYFYTLAIDREGNLWSWGASYYGQLGRPLDDAVDAKCMHGPQNGLQRCNPTPTRITLPP